MGEGIVMKKRDRRPEETGGQWIDALCDLLKGGALAGLAAILSLLLCAVLVSAGLLRERWMEGAVLAVCVLGAMTGGLYAARRIGRRTLLVGLVVGAVLFLLLLTAGLLAYDTASVDQGGAGLLCACLCGGGIAGLLGSGGASKKKRRR